MEYNTAIKKHNKHSKLRVQSREHNVHRPGHKVTFPQVQMSESLVITKAGKAFDPNTSRGVSPWVMEWLGILTVVGLNTALQCEV